MKKKNAEQRQLDDDDDWVSFTECICVWCMQQHNNTLQKLLMSMNRQALINAFIERQRENFDELMDNLTVYYHDFRLYFSEKSHQRYLFLSIIFLFIILTIISLIIFEYRRLLKYFRILISYNQLIILRIRNKFLRKTTPSLLNLFLNSKSSIREKFSKEFLRSLNDELFKRKVNLLSLRTIFCFFICTPYCCLCP